MSGSAARPRSRSAALLDAIMQPLVNGLERVVPKDGRTVLFCGHLDDYSGNNRALYEAFLVRADMDARWVCRSRKARGRVPGAKRAAWWLAPGSLWRMLRAPVAFVSHSPSDLFPLGRWLQRTSLIYLNHGVPLKTLLLAREGEVDPQVRRNVARYHHALASSEFERDLWVRCLGIAAERVWVTGAPRSVYLLEEHAAVREALPAGRIVLFAPTFRRRGQANGIEDVPGMDMAALDAVLRRHDAYLLVRGHYYAGTSQAASDRVRAADQDTFPEVNELLPSVDVLITDYSSIYIDFLLLDRPMIFADHDREGYEQQRGFLFEYDEHTPGAHAATGAALIEALDQALSGQDAHKEHRARIRTLFHEYMGAELRDSPERIAQHLFTDAGVRRA